MSHGSRQRFRARSGAARVSVVVTAVGFSESLTRCLTRLLEQTTALEAETILAINDVPEALAPDARAELERLVDRIVFEPRPGKSAALNTAVEACRGELVAFTDDDAVPGRGWLAALVTPLLAPHRDSRLAGCGGPVMPVFPAGGAPAWYRRILAREHSIFLGPHQFLGNRSLDYAPIGASPLPFGANCAFRRELLLAHPYALELGPNRSTGLRGGEDSALALVLIAGGHRLRYVADARVYHPVAPQRMSKDYVRLGYQMQGVEYARICRYVGIPLSRQRLEYRLRRRQRRFALKRLFLGADRRCRQEFRLEFMRSLLGELARLERIPAASVDARLPLEPAGAGVAAAGRG